MNINFSCKLLNLLLLLGCELFHLGKHAFGRHFGCKSGRLCSGLRSVEYKINCHNN